ncbi:hypothetical protein AcV5_010478 [Taiwanofungus camphoratus]|nr:hypothetical protein AcW2_001318 [Antrodia cinnamomea]KAI0935760.1 hypothetical protein AcV5_010478 [Antrodia cinnamomea]
MALVTRRHLCVLFATFFALSFSLWMFFGPGSLSLGLTTSVILHDLGILFTQDPENGIVGFRHFNKHVLPTDWDYSVLKPDHDVDGFAPFDYHKDTLGIASDIYVISLPHRTDRRATMERLRQALGLQWIYVNAIHHNDEIVRNIMAQVRRLRGEYDVRYPVIANPAHEQQVPPVAEQFQWPSDFDMDVLTRFGDLASPEFEFELPQTSESSKHDWIPGTDSSGTTVDLFNSAMLYGPKLDVTDDRLLESSDALLPLTCSTRNFITGPPYAITLPAYMILTPAKVACWFSHLEVIERIANSALPQVKTKPTSQNDTKKTVGKMISDDVAVVLEDDIDMEWDIRRRLQSVWSALPDAWDIVFLGHCWSNETHYPALSVNVTYTASPVPRTTLHPSYAPKCTHAYALSRTGARRLLLHLRHPPFAYSRALDQALAWLVLSGRIKAFSVVPSVIVQRKVAESDIDAGRSGMGSMWREHLANGVLGG